MSLVRSCVRICAVAALRDRLWESVDVYDSDNTPLVDAVQQKPHPYVTVYTDDDDGADIEARDIESGSRTLTMVIEFGIAAPMPAAAEGEGPTVAVPQTDASYELVIDSLDRQIGHALFTDPRSSWGEHLRRMVLSIRSISRKRGGATEKGVRFAARQIVFQLQVLADPVPGVVLNPKSPILLFLDAAEAADPKLDIAKAVPFLRSEVNITADWSWRQAQALLGLTREEVEGIGLAPAVITDDVEAPLTTAVDPLMEANQVDPYPGRGDGV